MLVPISTLVLIYANKLYTSTYKYMINKNKLKEVNRMSTETLTINIEKDLKTELKIIAIKQHCTVTDILINLIQDYVDENK